MLFANTRMWYSCKSCIDITLLPVRLWRLLTWRLAQDSCSLSQEHHVSPWTGLPSYMAAMGRRNSLLNLGVPLIPSQGPILGKFITFFLRRQLMNVLPYSVKLSGSIFPLHWIRQIWEGIFSCVRHGLVVGAI